MRVPQGFSAASKHRRGPIISKHLIDTLRDGTAPPVVRRKGAAGNLPVEVGERLEILVLLADDADEEIRRLARATLQSSLEADSGAEGTGEVAEVPGAERETLLVLSGRSQRYIEPRDT